MTSFPPIDQSTVSAITDTFSKVSTVVMGLMGLVIVARFSLLAIQVGSVDRYAAVVREAVVVLITIALFPFLLKTSVSAISELASRFEFQSMDMGRGAVDEAFEEVLKSQPALWACAKIVSISFLYLVRTCFTLLLAIMCSAIPLVLLIEFIFGSRIGVATIGSTILALLSWPILWNLIGLLAMQLAPVMTETSVAGAVFSMMVHLIQLLSPLFCFALIKTAAPHAAASAFMQLPLGKVAIAAKVAKKAM